ncbi:MAG: divalent-cation tolerance protein CutA [bacterium]
MSDLRIILTTFSSEADAATGVRQLLEERLIACGTILPGARSIYHWKRVVEEAAEVIVFLKTDQERSKFCMARLAELHLYDTPEIVVLHPEDVSNRYLLWVKESLSKTDSALE